MIFPSVAVRLVTKALVVVELPTIKSVILARVATSDEMKELVEVLLVVTRLVEVALTAVRLVVDALVRYAFVAVIPVAEALLSVVCPFTTRLLEIDTLVVDAFPSVV